MWRVVNITRPESLSSSDDENSSAETNVEHDDVADESTAAAEQQPATPSRTGRRRRPIATVQAVVVDAVGNDNDDEDDDLDAQAQWEISKTVGEHCLHYIRDAQTAAEMWWLLHDHFSSKSVQTLIKLRDRWAASAFQGDDRSATDVEQHLIHFEEGMDAVQEAGGVITEAEAAEKFILSMQHVPTWRRRLDTFLTGIEAMGRPLKFKHVRRYVIGQLERGDNLRISSGSRPCPRPTNPLNPR